MKCAVCGNEFGVRNTCQHCGADKVTALGNYSGYDTPNSDSFVSCNESHQQGDFTQSKIKKVESMVCYACGEIIPADSRFCPHCSKELYVTCPKCGCEYSSQYPTCNKCGTNRVKYNEEQKRISIKKAEEENRKNREQEAQREAWAIRSQLNYDTTSFSVISTLIYIGACIGIWLSVGPSLLLVISPLPFVIIKVIILAYYEKYRTKERIEQWKREHPNHRATPYL